NSDQAKAFTALVEGDATITELLYMIEYLDDAEQDAARNASASADISAFLAAPLVIRRSIAFPYVEGRLFVIDLYLQNSDFEAINGAYEYVPRSTEQIIHVDKYYAREEPIEVVLPDIAVTLVEGWTELDRDTLGELFIRSYLEFDLEFRPGSATSSIAAAGWGGDQYVLLENEAGETLFASMIVWDTEEDAVEFYLAYQDLMEFSLGGTWEELVDIKSTLTMETDSQRALINLDGLITVIVLSPDLDTALAAINSVISMSSVKLPPTVVGPGPSQSGPVASFSGGVHQVNTDIQPGTYRNSDSSSGCYWARLSGFSGEPDDIIANEITDEITIVTISSSDVGFESEGCGTWTKVN
ncbi:MAG: hypothetical protein IIB17_02340, partial [Chloroflexi bacterium]|nr:hypothetical protein [Chloroflexota bacterium]